MYDRLITGIGITSDELMDLIVDVTEQPINRPKNRQRKFYSGKKKDILSKLKS